MIFPEVIFNINNSENGKWLEDLKMFRHVKILHLYAGINELSFLSEFVNLKELYIKDSTETNWKFIRNMTNLKCLWINNCNFFDIDPIAELYKKQLELYEKDKLDTSDKNINLFKGLENLHLIHCSISDISPLSECRYLLDLDLSSNYISDLKPLVSLTSLYYLAMRYNNITDIMPLGNLKGLYYLNLRHNGISDISILKEFEKSNLSRLFLGCNKINDFTPVLNMNFLEDDIFDGCGEDRILRTNLLNRIPEHFLGELKFNDEMSKIANPILRYSINSYEKIGLYIGLYYEMEDWIKKKRIYFLLGQDKKLSNEEKGFEDYIHTSPVKKIQLENDNATLRIITTNSEYVFAGNPQKLLDYYRRNFLRKR